MPKNRRPIVVFIVFLATTLIMYAMIAGATDPRILWWDHPLGWMCSTGLGLVFGLIAYDNLTT